MSENNHPINEVLHTTMDKIREMVDANTVVGQPIVTQDGVTLIPVSKLSFGFATGGSDFGKAQRWCFGGGAGAGVNVMPIAFLIVKDGVTRVMPVAAPPLNTVDRVVEMVPNVVDQVSGLIEKNLKKKESDAAEEPAESL